MPVPPELTEFEKELRHVVPIAKHPDVIEIPTFEVVVAEPEMFKPESVVVPKPVPETVRYLVVGVDEVISKRGPRPVVVAWIATFAYGDEVPTPNLPRTRASWVKVDEAETMMPKVVVGASAALTTCQSLSEALNEEVPILLLKVV